MNKLAAGLIFVAVSQLLPLAAQSKPENNLSPRIRVYELKYMKRDRAGQVASFVHSVVNDVLIQWEPVVNSLVLYYQGPDNAAASNRIDKAEELLKRFDVPEPAPPPERQIEMTVSLIRAVTDAVRNNGSVPADLADVVKEMKGALPYAGFSLVDTMKMNVRDGLTLEDALPASVAELPAIPYFYSLMFHQPRISADGKSVSVASFRFGVKIPLSTTGGVQYQDESITTPLTLYDGQKQVLGKVKLRPSSGDDLFVVLSCKVK